MRLIRLISVFSIYLLLARPAFAEEQKKTMNLSQLVTTALNNNPEIKASNAKWQMFLSRVKQVSSLEDPMFMFKLQNLLARKPISILGGTDPQTAQVIGISQQIPYFGKLAIKKEIAEHEAQSYRWSVEERKLELSRMVKETYYQIWGVNRLLGVIDKNISILSDFVTIAETKYSVGQGAQQDIYKASLEKSKMIDMQITLKQQKKSLEATMKYLLNSSEDTDFGDFSDISLSDKKFAAEELKKSAFEKRPQIKSLLSLINKGDAAHRLAQKEYYPDFNLSFEYMFKEKVDTDMAKDPGYNMFTLGVTFNLPFQKEKRQAMLAESSNETSMASEELNSLKNSISFGINENLIQMERRQKLIELYKKGIIPQAEQTLESAVISYRVNKVDFLTLLDARMNLFNYERELYESETEYMMKLAQLEATVGEDLTLNQTKQSTDESNMMNSH